MNTLQQELRKRIYNYEHPAIEAPSKKFPILYKPIIFIRHLIRDLVNSLDYRMNYDLNKEYYRFIVARHQSVLRRQLGDSDPKLQEQKIINIRQALKKLDGVIIEPGRIFSFWQIVGKPSYADGYVDGMLLANGKVVEGLGGGLCQLSNFLYWIFLHSPVETVERHHHALDTFKDSGRILPFGSGATIFYNFVDLKIKNISSHPLQLKLWLTNTHLKGQVRSPAKAANKYHVFELHHHFIKKGSTYFRYNQIHRETKLRGKVLDTQKITTNFAPVLYTVTNRYLQENNYKIINLS
jgi:vancomycin resistance protein VanW